MGRSFVVLLSSALFATINAHSSELIVKSCDSHKTLLQSVVQSGSRNSVVVNFTSDGQADTELVLTDTVTGETYRTVAFGESATIANLAPGTFTLCSASGQALSFNVALKESEKSVASLDTASIGLGILGIGAATAGIIAATDDNGDSDSAITEVAAQGSSGGVSDGSASTGRSTPSSSSSAHDHGSHTHSHGGASAEASDCRLDEEPDPISPF